MADDLVATYLRALTTADAGLAVSLFTDDGVVHSPLYGPRPARDFYPALFADTSQANLTLRSVMSGKDQAGQPTVSFWFHFDWRLPSGAAAPFDVVDVATLGRDGKIRKVYPTSAWALAALNQLGTRLGTILGERFGLRGVWGFDVIVDSESRRIYLIDVNPRFQGSTAHEGLSKVDEGLAPLAAFHLLEFLDIEYRVDVANYNEQSLQLGHYSYLKVFNVSGDQLIVEADLGAAAEGVGLRHGCWGVDLPAASVNGSGCRITCGVPSQGLIIEPHALVCKIDTNASLVGGDGVLRQEAQSVVNRALTSMGLGRLQTGFSDVSVSRPSGSRFCS